MQIVANVVQINGCHKARCIYGDRTTNAPIESVYFVVVSLCSLSLVIFAGELHGLTLRGADVGNEMVKTATYDSKFVAARIITEQVIDPRKTSCYVEIPIRKESFITMAGGQN